MKTLALTIFSISLCFLSFGQYNQNTFACSSELSLYNDSLSGNFYNHYTVMKYNRNTGVFRITMNLGLITTQNISTGLVDEQNYYFPEDSMILTIEAVIPSNQLEVKGDAMDLAFMSVPITVTYNNTQMGAIGQYSIGVSMRQGGSLMYLNWDVELETLPGTHIYVPSLSWNPTRMRLQILDGFVNYTDY